MKKIVLFTIVIGGVALFAAATKPDLYRSVSTDVKRTIIDMADRVPLSKPQARAQELADAIKNDIKDRFHDYSDKHYGGDTEPVKAAGDFVIDHPADFKDHPVKGVIAVSKESSTASPDKDEVLDKNGNTRPESLIKDNVIPDLPKDVGHTEVRPNGPSIGAAPDTVANSFEHLVMLGPVSQSAPTLERNSVGPEGHGEGRAGTWAGHDAHSPQVGHIGDIASR